LYHHSGCSDVIVPTSSLHLTTVAVFDSSSAITYLLTRARNVDTYEMFKINGTDQLVNSSFCHISSLEVYRGRDQAIEISNQGFSLSENGSIKVHKYSLRMHTIQSHTYLELQLLLQITTGELGYDPEDYIGELFHMNLSCSSGGLPESGCLFFKAAGSLTTGYVTNGRCSLKFHSLLQYDTH
jgi:hypothetical protein